MKPQLIITSLIFLCSCAHYGSKEEQWIKPWKDNPHYWEYKGKPVLLLGATDNVNLFQISHLESHLDSLKACGGNYIRNGMNDGGPGNVRKYARTADEKYDLNQWNDEYWRRFENTLKLAGERDIIVQVEVWDRFNHTMC